MNQKRNSVEKRKRPHRQSGSCSTIHDQLCFLARLKMFEEGYKNIVYQGVICPGKSLKIDVMGFKDGKKIGVECLTPYLRNDDSNPYFRKDGSNGYIFGSWKKKIKKYGPYLDKIIFAIPSIKKRKIRKDSMERNCNVWIFNIEHWRLE